MSEYPRHDPDRVENAEQILSRRLQLGSDQDLLAHFGGDLDESDAEFVESGRLEIFAQGFLTEADISYDRSQLLAVSDHGEVLYPGFQFEPGSAVPLRGAAYANALIKSSGDFHPWEAAFWWISNTLLLDGRTPLEVLGMDSLEAQAFLRQAVEREVFDDGVVVINKEEI